MNSYKNDHHGEFTNLDFKRKKQRIFTNLNLFFGLLVALVAFLSLLFWWNILNVDNLWQAIISGFGLILILISVKMFTNPSQRSYALTRFIPGMILLAIGLSFLFGFVVL